LFFCLHWLLVVFLDFWRRGGFEIVDVKGTSSFHKRSSAVGCLTEVPLLEQEQELGRRTVVDQGTLEVVDATICG
jgi:hypothetical protein